MAMLQATAYKIDREDTSKLCLKSTKLFQGILLKSSSYRFYRKGKKKKQDVDRDDHVTFYSTTTSYLAILLTIM